MVCCATIAKIKLMIVTYSLLFQDREGLKSLYTDLTVDVFANEGERRRRISKVIEAWIEAFNEGLDGV
jgi:hypothetical protein